MSMHTYANIYVLIYIKCMCTLAEFRYARPFRTPSRKTPALTNHACDRVYTFVPVHTHIYVIRLN